MDPASLRKATIPKDICKKYLHFPFTFYAESILRAHGDLWNKSKSKALDEQFFDIGAYVTPDIVFTASWIKTAFGADRQAFPTFSIELARDAIDLMASTSMICLAFIRLGLKSLAIPKSKRKESCTEKAEGNSAEMGGQSSKDHSKTPQWKLLYTTDLCRKEMYSKRKFDDQLVTSAFLKDVLEQLARFCRDKERVLMKEWFGDQSSTAGNEDLEELLGETGVEGETSSEDKDVIKNWIDKALKILNFSDIPPHRTHPDDKRNLPGFVYVLKPKASTQLVPEQSSRPQTDSATVLGSADQSAAGTSDEIKRDDCHPQLETGKLAATPILASSLKLKEQALDSRSEQGSQKESVDFKWREIGGSSESAAENANAEKEMLQGRIAWKFESEEHDHLILERRALNDEIEETSENVAPPQISLILQLLNYMRDLASKIENLKISGVLPLPDSKKEDVKAVFAGLQKCLGALKLATIMKKKCGEYVPYLSHFIDSIEDLRKTE